MHQRWKSQTKLAVSFHAARRHAACTTLPGGDAENLTGKWNKELNGPQWPVLPIIPLPVHHSAPPPCSKVGRMMVMREKEREERESEGQIKN